MKSKAFTQGITAPLGFKAAGGAVGIKASGAPDLTLIVADADCAIAGVFTTNQVKGAPVITNQRHMQKGSGRAGAIICNSGNSNSGTGAQGLVNARKMCEAVADAIGCKAEQVYPNSTGVIGRPFPIEKIVPGVAQLTGRFARGAEADAAAARGIMTTDLVPKTAFRKTTISGKTVSLAGICKGSGMIAPNMATMLAFITTDAAIAPHALQAALSHAAAQSFNRISVDQHESPSDTVLVMASGKAENSTIELGRGVNKNGRAASFSGELAKFADALTDLARDLAYQIVKDGEGASKVFRVIVRGAATVAHGDRIARTVIDSPLVKTAVHGGDPNWGRLVTAAGYAGVRLDVNRMNLHINAAKPGFASQLARPPALGICVYRAGAPTRDGANPSAKLRKIMAGKEMAFTLEVGDKPTQVEWLGCDLSREYIRINADYTT